MGPAPYDSSGDSDKNTAISVRIMNRACKTHSKKLSSEFDEIQRLQRHRKVFFLDYIDLYGAGFHHSVCDTLRATVLAS